MGADEVAHALRRADKILIASHVRPDGDAVGSQLAAASILEAMGKRCRIVDADPVPARYAFLDPGGRIEPPPPPSSIDADLALVLDCAHRGRLGAVEKLLPPACGVANVDHHASGSSFGTVNWIDPALSSVGEMLWLLAEDQSWEIPPPAVEAIYVAILTDTGRFTYDNTTPESHQIAAEAIRRGVDASALASRIYESLRRGEMDLRLRAMKSLSFDETGRIGWVVLTEEDFARTGTVSLDAHEIVDIPRSVAGVEVAFLLTPVEGGEKVSLRSRGAVDVDELARAFGGGGHRRAAGFTLRCAADRAREITLSAITERLRGKEA